MGESVTIILPTYNGQRYIRQMLDSVSMQDHRPIELVVTDDASTDATVAVVKEWSSAKSADDMTVRLIRNPKNRGISANISGAVRHVHGRYLFLADQDDVWRPTKISEQVRYLQENGDCIMCINDRSLMDKDGKVVCRSLFRYKGTDTRKRDRDAVFERPPRYPANCMCLRTEQMDKIFPIPPGILCHDIYIAVMAAHYGKIGYLKKPLTSYRIHGENLSGQYALETEKDLFRAGRTILRSLKRNNRIADNDPAIVAGVLKERSGGEMLGAVKRLYPRKVDHVYLSVMWYILRGMSRWKRFC